MEDTTENKGDVISLAEHYKLVVQETREIAEARDASNQWFGSLVILVLTAQGYLLITFPGKDPTSAVYVIGLGLIGLLITLIWFGTVSRYTAFLAYRYLKLREWETGFPPKQQFYTTEANEQRSVSPFKVLTTLCALLFASVIVIRCVTLFIALGPQAIPFWPR